MQFFTEYDYLKPEFENITGEKVTDKNQALYLSWLSAKISAITLQKLKDLEEKLSNSQNKQ